LRRQHTPLSEELYSCNVTIEKAFAINAAPADIWDALWQDLSHGDEGHFKVETSTWPSLLAVQVKLGDLPARLTYRIEAKEGHCEVAVTLDPLSSRYRLYQLLTFGHLRRNYEILLVQGLVNLKEAVEGGSSVEDET
jgi:hypothetical protein